jgi:HPt (histidine-containing phosphotransfer) domain-containing protein
MDRWFRKTTQEEDPQTELAHLASPAGSQESPAPRSVEPAELDWDLKELLERLEGDQEFLRELLATFREDYRACLHKVHRAMAESNLPELSRAAHTIKGMLRNLSMNSAAQTATALEKSAQDAAEKESAQLLLILEGDLAKILPEVEAQLAGVKA